MKVLTAILVITAFSACGTQVAEQQSPADGKSQTEQLPQKAVGVSADNFCDELGGQTWQSIEQLDAGRSVNGMAKMHWKITFENGQFRWRYADVVEMGTYTCEANILTLTSAMKDPRATGSFTTESSELLINNVRYVRHTE